MVLSSRSTQDGPAPGAVPGAAGASNAERPRAKRDTAAINSPHLHRLQRRHFLLFDILPFVGTLAALGLLLLHPLGWVDIALLAGMWLLTGLGLTVGYHRLFTHQSFSTSPAISVAFLVLGSMAGRGPMVSWVAMHRRHHERSDREGDMHSPNLHGQSPLGRLRGWAHAHLTWMFEHEYPNVAHYVPDLLRERTLMATNQRYYTWVVLGLALPALIGGVLTQSWMGALTGFLWGGVVRMFAVEHCMSAVNSFLHLMGSRPFNVRGDNSRNSGVLSLFTWGEGWHNNHHAFPYSAAFGLEWYQFDLGFLLIRALQGLGLVWNVKVPTRARIAARGAALGHPDTST
jgi:stearoyl-CoA desaturase (delta-9 desaturase)